MAMLLLVLLCWTTLAMASQWGFRATDAPAAQGTVAGARLTEVTPGGAAALAGLRPGDIVIQCAGQAVRNAQQLSDLVHGLDDADRLPLTVMRDGWEKQVTLTRAPAVTVAPQQAAAAPAQDPCAQARLGINVADSASPPGALVLGIDQGEAADLTGIRVGDVVRAIGGTPVADGNALAAYVAAVKPGEARAVEIERQGTRQVIQIVFAPLSEEACLARRVRHAMQALDFAEARRHAAAWVAKQPANARAQAALGDVLSAQGEFAAAREAFRKAQSLAPDAPAYTAEIGITYAREKNWQEAETHLRLALERDPKQLFVWLNLGILYRDQQRLEDAYKAFLKAAEVQPDHPGPYMELGRIEEMRKNWNEAERHYRQALEKEPRFAMAWAGLGFVQGERQRYEEAVEAYRKALELGPPEGWIVINYAVNLGRIGKLAQARPWLERATQFAPGDPAVHGMLGDIFASEGKWPEAEKLYMTAIERGGQTAPAWDKLAQALCNQNRPQEALQAHNKALELGPPSAWAATDLAFCHYRLGQPAEAKKWFMKSIEIDPRWAAPHMGLGSVFRDERNWPEAERHFARAAELEPGVQAIWQLLGDARGEQRKHAPAIEAYRKALETGPPTPDAYYGLGWNLYNENKFVEAEDALSRAHRLNPADPNTLLTLGSAQMRAGKKDDAVRSWQQSAQLDPSGPLGQVARQNLARLGYQQSVQGAGPPPAGRSDGRKATVAVGDFQVKAATAGQFVGDGLREMLVTSLHNSGYFLVVERMDLEGVAAEQALSRSAMARPGAAIQRGQMEVADIMVYGAVTEFEAEAGGSAFQFANPKVPFTIGQQIKFSHMAIDIRVVDMRTGRVLAAQRIPGAARSVQGTIGATLSAKGIAMPASFGMFRNTPMEEAIRDCVQKAGYFIINNISEGYFRH